MGEMRHFIWFSGLHTNAINHVLYLQGERILKLAEQCRKLETEEEKVLPFYASSLTEEEQEDVAAAVAEPPSEPLAEVSQNLFTG